MPKPGATGRVRARPDCCGRTAIKTNKEKAEEILRKRKLAAEGLDETPSGENLLEDPEEKKEEELGDEALIVDFGLKR